jgi:DHA1 family bicyclomycin/chloramphenicol resistance-like MFS transporter
MASPAPRPTISQSEFIALMAMLFATIAFSVDSMLPAMPEITAELTPDAPNRAQLIITSFVLGMGIGTLFTGPLSDAFGRKPIILAGAVLYCVASGLAWIADDLEMVLIARVLQGLGAAGPRVAALAIVRDLFSGREMARLMSFIFLVFSLFPAVAPAMGAGIIWFTGWRGIFGAFIIFAIVSNLWLSIRLSETLPRENRRPFSAADLWAGIKEIVGVKIVRQAILVQSLGFGMLFSVLSATQQVFDITFGYGDSFPAWFALIALISASSSLVNARFVQRVGMRPIIRITLIGQAVISGLASVLWATGLVSGVIDFGLFFLTFGNLNTLAMEPMGHRAGLTASVVGSVGTVLGAVIGALIGQAFDGTPLPLAVGGAICAILGALITSRMERVKA